MLPQAQWYTAKEFGIIDVRFIIVVATAFGAVFDWLGNYFCISIAVYFKNIFALNEELLFILNILLTFIRN